MSERDILWFEYTASVGPVAVVIIPQKGATIVLGVKTYKRTSGELIIQPRSGAIVTRYSDDPSATDGFDIGQGKSDTRPAANEVRAMSASAADVYVTVCFEAVEVAA